MGIIKCVLSVLGLESAIINSRQRGMSDRNGWAGGDQHYPYSRVQLITAMICIFSNTKCMNHLALIQGG